MLVLIAATGGGQFGTAEVIRVLAAIGLVMLLVIVAGAGLMVLRRRVTARDTDGHESLMQDLRAMRDSGAMSQEEYDLARKKLAARIAGPKVETAAQSAKPPVSRSEG